MAAYLLNGTLNEAEFGSMIIHFPVSLRLHCRFPHGPRPQLALTLKSAACVCTHGFLFCSSPSRFQLLPFAAGLTPEQCFCFNLLRHPPPPPHHLSR